MKTRPLVLLTLAIFSLAACAGAPTPAAVPPTIAPASTIAPTQIPPTAILTTNPAAPPALSDAPLLTPPPTPRALAFGKSYLDVHYCTDGATPLKMNIIVPNEINRLAPVLIHLKYQSELIRPLVAKGFIVADVPYREPPDYKLPAGVEDVKCAIRYLRAHASQYNLDTQHIGVFGCSRGGHIAAMLGTTDSDAGMDGNFGFANESSRVQAVMMFDGIANFRTNYYGALDELQIVHGINSFDDPMVARLSPITYATRDDPPFLILASESDHWSGQAQEMASALAAQGAAVTYLPAEGATHCQYAQAGPHTREKMIDLISEFFIQAFQ